MKNAWQMLLISSEEYPRMKRQRTVSFQSFFSQLPRVSVVMACPFRLRILITSIGVMAKLPRQASDAGFLCDGGSREVPISVDFEDEPGSKHVTFVKVIAILRMVDSYDIRYAFQGEVMAVPFQIIHNRLGR